MAEKDRRVLTLVHASATVIANMIGTCVFTTTGLMVGMGAAGGDILLVWLVGGIVALCGALSYGEIGANLPESGGDAAFQRSRHERIPIHRRAEIAFPARQKSTKSSR